VKITAFLIDWLGITSLKLLISIDHAEGVEERSVIVCWIVGIEGWP
jgi:hypothetical protein